MTDKSYRILRYPSHLTTVGELNELLGTLDDRVARLSDIKPKRGGKQLRYTGELNITGLRALLGQLSPNTKLFPNLLLNIATHAEQNKCKTNGKFRRMVKRLCNVISWRHLGFFVLVIYLLVLHVYAAMYVLSVARNLPSNVKSEILSSDNKLQNNNEASAYQDTIKTVEDTFRISYGNESSENVLHVFIDPECPFCKKMEPELSALIKKGWHVIKYPVAVLGEKSSADVQTIFCSKQPDIALRDIMAGKDVASLTCDNARNAPTVNTDFFLGIGLDRVPVVVYGTTGKFIVGFHTASEIEDWVKTLKQ